MPKGPKPGPMKMKEKVNEVQLKVAKGAIDLLQDNVKGLKPDKKTKEIQNKVFANPFKFAKNEIMKDYFGKESSDKDDKDKNKKPKKEKKPVKKKRKR